MLTIRVVLSQRWYSQDSGILIMTLIDESSASRHNPEKKCNPKHLGLFSFSLLKEVFKMFKSSETMASRKNGFPIDGKAVAEKTKDS